MNSDQTFNYNLQQTLLTTAIAKPSSKKLNLNKTDLEKVALHTPDYIKVNPGISIKDL